MIIGIAGKKQCGKDTICNIIRYISWIRRDAEQYGRKPSEDHFQYVMAFNKFQAELCVWEKHAWADKLKQCAALILGVQAGLFEDEWFKNSFTSLPLSNKEGEPMTNREFLQYLGTEVGRSIDKDLWVKSLLEDYRQGFQQIPEYGITEDGLRVPLGMSVISPSWIIPDTRFPNEADAILKEGGILIKVERDTGLDDNHPSEHALDNYDKFTYIVNNDGTLQELIDQIVIIMDDLECRNLEE